MTARVARRRTRTAREIAEQFGITRATVVRMVAEPRADYEQRARTRREAVVALRRQGLTYREIAAQTGDTPAIVGRLLADARRHGEWATAVARPTSDHTE